MTLKEWLESLRGISDVKLVTIHLGKEVFEGAMYTRTSAYTEGMSIVANGVKKAGETYTETFIYCLGDIPKLKQQKKKTHVCFPYEGHDWYVACYIRPGKIEPQYEEFHPFGPNFILNKWDISGEKIDHYEPYERVPMTVTFR